MKFLKDNKRTIYAESSIPGSVAGPFHGLFLQLLANGIIELTIDKNESKNIGSDKILSKHIVVELGQRDIVGALGKSRTSHPPT